MGEEADIAATKYWHALPDGRVQCDVCPRACKMHEGQRGLCFVRAAQGGEVVLTTYGRSSGFCIDPIEKKPLNHFLPGTPVLSFGTAGCNLACSFCQNWDISKAREMDKLSGLALPEQLAEAAQSAGCPSIAFTYNDPVVFMEYAIDIAQACRARGVRTVAVTAGYMNDAPRREFYAHMDAANVDLKGFTPEFYRRHTKSELAPVLDTLAYLRHETSVWFEITTLLIPGENDSDAELEAECRWIMDNLGPDVPLHFSAFHPDYRMRDKPPTPPATLKRARRIARGQGLNYVYTGNIHDPEGASTWCPGCGLCLIGRDWHEITAWNLTETGACKECGAQIPGLFEPRPGTWGRKRLPVRVSGNALTRIETGEKRMTDTTRTYLPPQKPDETALPPQVAGKFYPGDQSVLGRTVDTLMLKAAHPPMIPKALISPHAGYQYSGAVAASAYAALGKQMNAIRRVVIAGPAHRMPVRGAAVPSADVMLTPLGPVRVDREAVERLKAQGLVYQDDAPFQNEHCLETQLPFLQRTLENFAVVPVLIGRTTPEQAAKIFDAVWGGPETLIVVSSDLSHYHDDQTARRLDGATTAAIEALQVDKVLDGHACGAYAVRGLMAAALHRNLRATAIDLKNSGDATGDLSRVVGYGAYVFEPAEEARLPADSAAALLQVARAMILQGIGAPDVPRLQVNNIPRPLLSPRAAFTTIRTNGQLRGCRGSTVAHRALITDVAHNAWLSANRDPRFKPMEAHEFKASDVSVSILGAAHRLAFDSEEMLQSLMRPGIDGLILADGKNRGLFLPSVWEQIPEPAQFLRALKRKAGLPETHWSQSVEIFHFTAEKVGPVPLLED